MQSRFADRAMAVAYAPIGMRIPVLALAIGLLAAPALSQEAELRDRTASESVEGFGSALSRAIEEREQLHTLFPRLKRTLGQYPNFIADSEVVLDFRTFAFPLRNSAGGTAYAWTAGGKFSGRTGWYRDVLRAGLGVYMSFPIVEDDPLGQTDLLGPGGEGFAVLGEGFLEARWRDIEFTGGRFEMELPWVNKNDSRMAPNSFQGLRAKGVARGVPVVHRVDWVVGYLSDIRPRNENQFVSMSERAGAVDVDRGMILAGVQLQPTPETHLGFYEYLVPDTLGISYLAGDYLHKVSADLAFRFQGQFTHQRSLGAESIGSFRTWVTGLQGAASFRGATLWLGVSKTEDGAAIRSPYGAYPGMVSMMQSDFNRAGERAWNVGFSYVPRSLPRLSGFLVYGQGTGGLDESGVRTIGSERELDLTVDYKIDEGRLRGFWLRVRGSALDAEGAETAWQLRVMINYTLPVL